VPPSNRLLAILTTAIARAGTMAEPGMHEIQWASLTDWVKPYPQRLLLLLLRPAHHLVLAVDPPVEEAEVEVAVAGNQAQVIYPQGMVQRGAR